MSDASATQPTSSQGSIINDRQESLSLDELLTRALAQISESLPNIQSIHTYRYSREQLQLWASHGTKSPTGEEVLRLESPYASVLTTCEADIDLEAGRYILPLYTSSRVYGLLVVDCSNPGSDSEFIDSLLQFSDRLSLQIENIAIQSLLKQHAKASKDLISSTTFQEIAEALAQNILEPGQYLSLHLFDIMADKTYRGFRVVATANRKESYDTSEAFPQTIPMTDETLFTRLIENPAPIQVRDVATDKHLSEQLREWLIGFKIKSTHLFALSTAEQRFGFVALNDLVGTIDLSEAEVQAYQVLVDQVAMTIQNRNLLQQTEQSLRDVQNLYDLNQDILQASDVQDILNSLYQHIEGQPQITLVEVTYDANNKIQALITRYAANAKGTQEVDQALHETISPPALAKLSAYWQSRESNLHLIEDMQQDTEHPLRDTLLEMGIQSTAQIQLGSAGRQRQQLTISWQEPKQFDKRTQRLLETFQIQATLALEKQQLLRETQQGAAQLAKQVRVQQILNDLANQINLIQDESQLLDHACQTLTTALQIDHTGITLIATDGQSATVVNEYPDRSAVGIQLPVVGDIWQHLRAQRDPIAINNVDQHPDLEDASRAALQATGVKSVLFLPLLNTEGHLIGTAGLDIFSPEFIFTEDMISLAQLIIAQVTTSLQKLRLLKNAQNTAAQMDQQVRRLNTLNELATALNTIRDEGTLIENSVEIIQKALNVDHSSIAILTSDEKAVTVVKDYPPQGIVGLQLTIDDDPLEQRVVSSKKPIIINHVATNTELHEKNRQALVNIGVKSLMILPLLDGDQFIGSIGLDLFSDDRMFTTEDEAIAETIAAQISTSLQRTRLLKSAQRQSSQMQHITRFSQSVQATQDLATILESALKISLDVIHFDHIQIALFDEKTAQLHTVAIYQDEQIQVELADEVIVLTEGTITGHVYQTGKSFHTHDLEPWSEYKPASKGSRSIIAIPLQTGNIIKGVIEASSQIPYSYTETDLAVFQQMGNQLTVAIENARAFIRSQQVATNKDRVNDIATLLQQQADMDGILNVTVNELGKALGARRGRIRLGAMPSNHNDT